VTLSAEPRKNRPEPEISAGGVVVRGRDVVTIVPTRRAADGRKVLALPKGHIDGGETPLQAAIREVREEAGVVVMHLADLGEVRYWYTRGGQRIAKAVSFFLFRYVSGDVEDHDEEVEEVRWMPLERARQELSYPGEREMVERAISLIEERGEPKHAPEDRKDR
jgi:8-oxo-dGTP pyrophosphatase MutT (NUDIX family)